MFKASCFLDIFKGFFILSLFILSHMYSWQKILPYPMGFLSTVLIASFAPLLCISMQSCLWIMSTLISECMESERTFLYHYPLGHWMMSSSILSTTPYSLHHSSLIKWPADRYCIWQELSSESPSVIHLYYQQVSTFPFLFLLLEDIAEDKKKSSILGEWIKGGKIPGMEGMEWRSSEGEKEERR